mmetsp:Transcript_70980/g.123116  ORF Transcript_70980/g.123116 Transcript_70980/m.123116 type:complete len:500 (+) Transcript_70980:58-1557(+)
MGCATRTSHCAQVFFWIIHLASRARAVSPEVNRLQTKRVNIAPPKFLHRESELEVLHDHRSAHEALGKHALSVLSGKVGGWEEVEQLPESLNQQSVDQLILDKLGDSYHKTRPIPDSSVFDGTHRIKIFIGLSFRKILEVDQIHGTLSMVVWLRRMWPDYRLRYDAKEYFGKIPMFGEGEDFHWNSSSDFVPIEQSSVWIPDIQIINAVKDSELINYDPRVFWYDGNKLDEMGYNMVLVTPEVVHVQCPMKLREFPFDTQSCEIKFGDWSGSDQYFEMDTIDRFLQHWDIPESDDEFKFDNAIVEKREVRENTLFVDADLPIVVYTLRLTRRPHYYLVKFVLPMWLLVILGQGLYWMDLEKERFSTGITVVLAVMTVGFLTAPLMPKTPDVMWLETFQVGCYILTCWPVFYSIFLDHHCDAEQAKKADAIGKVVHPAVVIIFYLFLFGLPGVNHAHEWPVDVPEVAVFLGVNILVFTMFAVSGLVTLPVFRQRFLKIDE